MGTNADNAALRVLPGTHHHFCPPHVDHPEARTDGDDHGNEAAIAAERSDQVTLAVGAGDASTRPKCEHLS